MRTPVNIESTNGFSSIIKMKFCSNFKDTMYFLIFLPSPEQKVGVGQKEGMAHVYVFPSK